MLPDILEYAPGAEHSGSSWVKRLSSWGYLSDAPQPEPQAAGVSAGLSAAPQAAGASAGLSDAPQAEPQAEAAPVPLFQPGKFESAIICYLLDIFRGVFPSAIFILRIILFFRSTHFFIGLVTFL